MIFPSGLIWKILLLFYFYYKNHIYIYIILKYGKHQNNLITMERSNDTIWNNQNIENLFEI
jgi:hypothetical protein